MCRYKVIQISVALLMMLTGVELPVRAVPLASESIVLQSQSYSCGAAAVATLLTYYYDQPVSEDSVLEMASASMQQRHKSVEANGIDALALRETLLRYGVESVGVQTDEAALVDYFQQGGLPIVLQIVQGESHYVVAVGVVTDGTDTQFVLADPATGYRLMATAELVMSQDYVALVPQPAGTIADEVRERQQTMLSRMANFMMEQRMGQDN